MSTHPADESANNDPSREPASTDTPPVASATDAGAADAQAPDAPATDAQAPDSPAKDAPAADAPETVASAAPTANPSNAATGEVAPAPASPAPATAGVEGAADAPTETTTGESESGASSASDGTDSEAPGSNIQIGSRRGDRESRPHGARPQTPHEKKNPQSAPTSQGPVPVPSKRALTDDLEQEVEAALAGQSLDDLMSSSETASATGEGPEMETRVTGKVESVHGDNVFLTLGGRNQGVASLRQFPEPPEVGASLEVVVSGVNREDGLYEVVVPGAAITVDDWGDLAEGAVVDAVITGSNTGGLECKVKNIRGFIPASQISIYRVENFAEFVDQKLTCVVTEANANRKNLVLSRRAVLEREREAKREKLLAELEVGQEHEGIVRNIRDFGAFVDIGGVDGLIHISQLSWERVNHPSEIVKEGETVKVRIEKIDPDTGKIGLSYRSLQEHPWTDVEEKFQVGSTVEGTVSRLANFGAFVKLATGIEGLVHVSELAHHRVSLVKSIVSEGDTVNVKVLSVDKENQRIGLSIKQTSEAPIGKKSSKKEEPEEERERALPKREGPLKGGVDDPSGGDQFGLKW